MQEKTELVLDDLITYVTDKMHDEEYALEFVLNLNQRELNHLFDMFESSHKESIQGGINGLPVESIITMKDYHPNT